MAVATSLYCTTQLHRKNFLKLLFSGTYATQKTLPYHKSMLASSLLPPVAVAATSSSVQAKPRTTATSPAKDLPFCIGHDFDLHRLEPGYPLIIGGANIPHDRGCEAHSDGDVLLHCVVDAISGALGLPDIVQIFRDTDPKWKGAASSVFVEEAVSTVPLICHD